MINRLAIIGVGLIGGSLARAVRDAGQAREIIGHGRGIENLQRAVALGVIDRVETTLATAVRDADMVVLATPVGSMGKILREIAPYLAPAAVVTDVGSVKGAVVDTARKSLGKRFSHFVPGHPIAGTEKSGVEASFASLYAGRRVVLTPLPETKDEAVARVRAMWQAAGAEVLTMTVEHHDTVLAATSHLPHLLAYTLVDMLARQNDGPEIFSYAAGGFRDFTRIASSDPVMWRDIGLANRDAIVRLLKQYRTELGNLIKAVDNGDGEALLTVFARAKAARDALAAVDQKRDEP